MEAPAARAFQDGERMGVVERALPGTLAGAPSGKGYLTVGLTFNGRERRLQTHRGVFALARDRWPEHEIDHEKGTEAGNGIANLREATCGQNHQNLKIAQRNTSGFQGVTWDKSRSKWQAKVNIGDRNIHIGRFATREAASTAYLAAKAIVHPFAPVPRGGRRLNSILSTE